MSNGKTAVLGDAKPFDSDTTGRFVRLFLLAVAIMAIAEMFGSARILSETLIADIRVSDLPDPRPRDLIVIGADSYAIQGEPIRDRDRLIWTVELVPA